MGSSVYLRILPSRYPNHPSRPPLKGRSPLIALNRNNYRDFSLPSPFGEGPGGEEKTFFHWRGTMELMQITSYFFDYITYIIINLLIGKANNRNSHVFKLYRAVNIMFLYFGVIMDTTIQFYYQVGFGTIKISNKLFDRMLAAEMITIELVISQILPEDFLSWCHIASQLFCPCKYLWRCPLEYFCLTEVLFHDYFLSTYFLPLPASKSPLPASPKGEEPTDSVESERLPRH